MVKLQSDGSVTWTGGNWKLAKDGTVLQILFNNVFHELLWDEEEGKAVLIEPVRTPPSTMTLKALRQGMV